MAYDKLCDSAALDAGLLQIANAIRAKGGTTGSLAFPTGMAEAITAIQAGGGSGGDTKLAVGMFVPAEDITSMTIEHNLGVKPKIFVMFSYPQGLKQNAITAISSYTSAAVKDFSLWRELTVVDYTTNDTTTSFSTNHRTSMITLAGMDNSNLSNVPVGTVDETNFYITDKGKIMQSGQKYHWVAIG